MRKKEKNPYRGALVRCRNCGDTIQSKHIHDWVACSCFGNSESTTGIFIDGGSEYLRMGGNLDGYDVLDKGRYRSND